MNRILVDWIIAAAIVLSVIGIKKVFSAELEEASIEYQHFHPSARFAEMPNYRAKEGLALNLETRVAGPLYWNHRIHALTDPGQYRLVGWQFELGVHPLWFLGKHANDSLQLYYQHHSQHILEGQHPFMKFPVNDSLGLRWVFFGNR